MHVGKQQVFFGAAVTYEEQETGLIRTLQIVGVDEADSLNNQVSWISPIARVLLKKNQGDIAKLLMPTGLQHIEILEVHYTQ